MYVVAGRLRYKVGDDSGQLMRKILWRHLSSKSSQDGIFLTLYYHLGKARS